jgi:hypothetical protein
MTGVTSKLSPESGYITGSRFNICSQGLGQAHIDNLGLIPLKFGLESYPKLNWGRSLNPSPIMTH